MIGNDIIDIKNSLKNSKRNRAEFIEKVFTEKEQLFISNSENLELMILLLWSMKESAYKIYVQQNQKRFFSPKGFESKISLINNRKYFGEVTYNSFLYKTISIITGNYISTIALKNDKIKKEKIIHENFNLSGTDHIVQNRETYYFTLKYISERIHIPFKNLEIKKNYLGIPYLFKCGKLIQLSLSLSHHYNYGSFAVLITE